MRTGDRILAVNQAAVPDLAGLWREIWSVGPAGASVRLTLGRGDRETNVTIASADRARFLISPSLH